VPSAEAKAVGIGQMEDPASCAADHRGPAARPTQKQTAAFRPRPAWSPITRAEPPGESPVYGAMTCATNVPQFAYTVRGPPGMYSVANQRLPASSTTAAE
jgi:hypothetical protein